LRWNTGQDYIIFCFPTSLMARELLSIKVYHYPRQRTVLFLFVCFLFLWPAHSILSLVAGFNISNDGEMAEKARTLPLPAVWVFKDSFFSFKSHSQQGSNKLIISPVVCAWKLLLNKYSKIKCLTLHKCFPKCASLLVPCNYDCCTLP
jgi:hypothetical protein